MNKILKIIVSGIIAIVVCYFAYFIFTWVRYGYHIEMENFEPYLWIFKDSVKKDIDTTIFGGFVRKRDIRYSYIYKHDYRVSIWEFKNLDKAKLSQIHINQGSNLDDIKFGSGELLNKGSTPEITVRFGPFFTYLMDINLDDRSKIIRRFETDRYKGFYGIVNKMSFSKETGEHQVIIDYPSGKEPIVCLVYKTRQSFYVIMIVSDKPFDESIINILNLP